MRGGLALFSSLISSVAAADVGTIQLQGELTQPTEGPVMIELLIPQTSEQHPLLAWSGVLNSNGGPFQVTVPAELGRVYLRAAIDPQRDGIGPGDPQTRVPLQLEIGSRDLHNVNIEIHEPQQLSPLPNPPAGERPGLTPPGGAGEQVHEPVEQPPPNDMREQSPEAGEGPPHSSGEGPH